MNAITNITSGAPLTMSSVEIAERCSKRHDNVMADIKNMLSQLEMPALSFQGSYIGANKKELPCFNLPKDLVMTLVTGYSIPLRKKIIDRLEELEARHPAVTAPDLSDPSILRGLLLENVEKVLYLQGKIEDMQSDVDALDKIAEAHGSMARTDAAKNLGVPPNVLIKWMATNGWTYRRPGTKEDLAYQSKINAGYLEHKVNTGPRPDGTEWISTQVRVTPKGLTILAKAFPSAPREI